MLRGIRVITRQRHLCETFHLNKLNLNQYVNCRQSKPFSTFQRDPLELPSYSDENYITSEEDSLPILDERVRDFSDFRFNETFISTCTDIHDVKEGGYIDVDREEIERLLPEGLAGEVVEEWEFSERPSWMIRDHAKLLCRILEQYEEQKQKSRGFNDFKITPSSLSTAIYLPGVTDRPEWSESNLKVFYHGFEIGKKINEISPLNNLINVDNESLKVVRGEGSQVQDVMNAFKEEGRKLPERILLTGPRGVGKSVAINQMVLHARRRGWLCLFVPKGWDQVQSGWYIEPVIKEKKEINNMDINSEITEKIIPSDNTEEKKNEEVIHTLYDNPFMSSHVLRGFWLAHEDILKTIPMKNIQNLEKYQDFVEKFKEEFVRTKAFPGREDFSFMQIRELIEAEDWFGDEDEDDAPVLDSFDFDENFQVKTLEELVRMGVAFRDFAGPIFMDLVTELRELDLPDHPVLIAVDQYNTWDVPSVYQFRNRPVLGTELCVPNALFFISKKKADSESYSLKNGLCVGATSMKHTEGKKNTYNDFMSSIPLVIKVPSYNQVEMMSAVSFYTEQGIIEGGMSTQDILTFRTIQGSNPRLFRTQAVPYFFPLAVSKLDPEVLNNMQMTDSGIEDNTVYAEVEDPDEVELKAVEARMAKKGGSPQRKDVKKKDVKKKK